MSCGRIVHFRCFASLGTPLRRGTSWACLQTRGRTLPTTASVFCLSFLAGGPHLRPLRASPNRAPETHRRRPPCQQHGVRSAVSRQWPDRLAGSSGRHSWPGSMPGRPWHMCTHCADAPSTLGVPEQHILLMWCPDRSLTHRACKHAIHHSHTRLPAKGIRTGQPY